MALVLRKAVLQQKNMSLLKFYKGRSVTYNNLGVSYRKNRTYLLAPQKIEDFRYYNTEVKNERTLHKEENSNRDIKDIDVFRPSVVCALDSERSQKYDDRNTNNTSDNTEPDDKSKVTPAEKKIKPHTIDSLKEICTICGCGHNISVNNDVISPCADLLDDTKFKSSYCNYPKAYFAKPLLSINCKSNTGACFLNAAFCAPIDPKKPSNTSKPDGDADVTKRKYGLTTKSDPVETCPECCLVLAEKLSKIHKTGEKIDETEKENTNTTKPEALFKGADGLSTSSICLCSSCKAARMKKPIVEEDIQCSGFLSPRSLPPAAPRHDTNPTTYPSNSSDPKKQE